MFWALSCTTKRLFVWWFRHLTVIASQLALKSWASSIRIASKRGGVHAWLRRRSESAAAISSAQMGEGATSTPADRASLPRNPCMLRTVMGLAPRGPDERAIIWRRYEARLTLKQRTRMRQVG